MTKDWVVVALLRIYPAAWRREYGVELKGILLGRPLGTREIADVAWNGVWQRARSRALHHAWIGGDAPRSGQLRPDRRELWQDLDGLAPAIS